MKKATWIALLALLTVSTTSVAFADPVEITGEMSLKQQRDHGEGSPATNGQIFTLTLDAKVQLSEKVSIYGRIGAQSVSAVLFQDFNPDAYGAGKKTVVGLDQFGLTWKQDELVYKLGRQDLAVGSTALLYSKPSSNIGKHAFVDGLSVNGTVGDTEVAFFAGKEDSVGSIDNRLFALRASYSPNDTWTYGATLGRYVNKAAGETTNHWALDGSYKFGKHTLTAEYARSSKSSDNSAYAAVWGYNFDDKLSVSVTGFRVAQFADMGGNSDFDNDNRGIHYGAQYKFDDNLSLETIYKDQKTLTTGGKNNSLEITLRYTF